MSRASAKQVKVGQGRKFDLVLTPVITEKATQGSEHNQVTFRVPLEPTRGQDGARRHRVATCLLLAPRRPSPDEDQR